MLKSRAASNGWRTCGEERRKPTTARTASGQPPGEAGRHGRPRSGTVSATIPGRRVGERGARAVRREDRRRARGRTAPGAARRTGACDSRPRQGLVRRSQRRRRADAALSAQERPRRDRVADLRASRSGGFSRRRGKGVPHPCGRAQRGGERPDRPRQGPAAPAGEVPRPRRPRGAGSPALPGPARQPGGAGGLRGAVEGRVVDPPAPRGGGLHGSRDADDAAHPGGRGGAAFQDPPQHPRPRSLPENRTGAVPQAAASSAASRGSSSSTATSATRASPPGTTPSSRCSSSTGPTPTTSC